MTSQMLTLSQVRPWSTKGCQSPELCERVALCRKRRSCYLPDGIVQWVCGGDSFLPQSMCWRLGPEETALCTELCWVSWRQGGGGTGFRGTRERCAALRGLES